MLEMEVALIAAKKRSTSDLHSSVGRPSMVHSDVTESKLNEKMLDPGHADALVLPLLSDAQRKTISHKEEMNFAYSLCGVGLDKPFTPNSLFKLTNQNIKGQLIAFHYPIQYLQKSQAKSKNRSIDDAAGVFDVVTYFAGRDSRNIEMTLERRA